VSARAVALFRGTRRIDALDAGDRGLAYGDGLFGTMRLHAGRPVWWDAHAARLAAGAARLGIAMPDAAWLEATLHDFARGESGPAVVKVVLTRGSGGRGYAAPPDAVPTLLLALHDAPPPGPAALVLRWCETRVAVQPALAGIKHLNRLEQVLARREWSDPAVHEGLMLDTDGRVAGATSANVFARLDGRWCTPPVDRRGIAGIARGWILANAGDAREAELGPADIARADAVFLCNAVRGILPVGSLGDRRWAPHPALDDLRRRLGRCEPAFDPGS
jgi:4-amino-4-deoxychorismate lyase